MAINISNAFVTLFDAEVKQAYQGESKLRDTVRLRSGQSSNTVKFPKIGSAVFDPVSYFPSGLGLSIPT